MEDNAHVNLLKSCNLAGIVITPIISQNNAVNGCQCEAFSRLANLNCLDHDKVAYHYEVIVCTRRVTWQCVDGHFQPTVALSCMWGKREPIELQ